MIQLNCPPVCSLTTNPQTNPVRPHVRLARSATIRKVQDVVHQNFGNNYRVELFGSISYGVDTPTSDLDLVVMVRLRVHLCSPSSLKFTQDTNRMNGFSPSINLNSLPCKYILHPADHLRTQDSFCSQVIYDVTSVTARIPRISGD